MPIGRRGQEEMRYWVRGLLAGALLAGFFFPGNAKSEARVTFFRVWVLAGYEGLGASTFPGVEDEPTIMVVPRQQGDKPDMAGWLRELFRLESVDFLDLQTVVEVHSEEVSGAQPSFFDVGEAGEFRVWWLGGISAPVGNLLTVSLGVDFQGQDLIPGLQVLCQPEEVVVVARRVAGQSDDGELESLAALGRVGLIFMLAVAGEHTQAVPERYRTVVDRYLFLRSQQNPTGGTIKVADDPGYLLLRQLFAQSLHLNDLDYGQEKRVPVSAGFSRPELGPYDVPPQLAKGKEALLAALGRVFTPEEMKLLAGVTLTVLVNEKGQAEEIRLAPAAGPEMRKRWWRAVRLLRWQPARWRGNPVRAWTVIPIGAPDR